MEAMTAWRELANMEAFNALNSGINTTSNIISIAVYVLTALALYAVAERRGISKPWLAWIPIANMWILGSISDQYQQTVKNKKTNRRTLLVVLESIYFIVLLVLIVVALVAALDIFAFAMNEGYSEEELIYELLPALGSMLVVWLVTIVVVIVRLVFVCICHYDYYCSCDPQNAVLFLVLGIVISYVNPILLFVVRNKDLGMQKPQYQQPYYQPPQQYYQPPQQPNE